MIGSLAATLDGLPVAAEIAEREDPRRLEVVPRGLYETVLVTRGRPHLAAAHARRLHASSAHLGLGAFDAARLVAEIRAVAARAGDRRCRLRVLRWRNERGVRQMVTLDPEPPPPDRIVLGIWPERRPCDLDARRHKRLDAPDLDRVRAAATEAGVFDLLVLDERDRVLEGAKTNVFWRTRSTIRTPSARLSLLPGTRRERLFSAARRAGFEVEEMESEISELVAAEEIIVTNAIQGTRRRVTLRTAL